MGRIKEQYIELEEALLKYADDDGFIRTKDLMTGTGLSRQTVLNKYIWPGRQAGLLSVPSKREIKKVDGGTMLVKFFKVKGAKK